MVSQKLKIAIYLNQKKAYQIAQEAGLNPSTLSKLLNGIEEIKPKDPRILKVAKIVGVSEGECFVVENSIH